MKRLFICLFLILSFLSSLASAQNQTDSLSPIIAEDLPFSLEISVAPFSLPSGLQSYVSATYKGEWILLAGRTNGLHGFDNFGNNFPPSFQNTTVFVINPMTGTCISRALHTDPDLTQTLIDELSVTAAQSYQRKNILYIVGGYGIDSQTGLMETKNTLTAIHLKSLIKWVKGERQSLKCAIKQVSHPLLQVTGGQLYQNRRCDPFLLILGQNFSGLYRDDSNGNYTQQIRAFWLEEKCDRLKIHPKENITLQPDYRRRDLNVVPVIRNNQFAYTAFAGVFTLEGGVWTVPITIFPDGTSFEENPSAPETFKQAMNHYNCPTFTLYSKKAKNNYVIFPGGISYGYFSNGQFTTDSEIPFINQITAIQIDKNNHYTQHLLNTEYPFITSSGSNPGNQLLFGASAQFIINQSTPIFRNGVIQLDRIRRPVVIGHIVGGIMSTLPNTNTSSDSTSSNYVFTVKLIPKI